MPFITTAIRVIVLLGFLFASFSSFARWSPKSLELNVVAGEPQTVTVVYRAVRQITAAALTVDSKLTPYVQVQPASVSGLRRGDTVQFTLTFSAPEGTFPKRIRGNISLTPQDSRLSSGSALQVDLQIRWPTIAVGSTGAAITYPTFGQPTGVDVTSEGATSGFRVFTFSPEADPLMQFSVGLMENPGRKSLTEWFASEVDKSGSILGQGKFRIDTLGNGVRALSVTEVPAQHLDCCGPVMDFYAISSSGRTIITVVTSHEHSFGSMGSPKEVRDQYLRMLSSMTFN